MNMLCVLLFRASSALLLILAVISIQLGTTHALVFFCSRNNYGMPLAQDCYETLQSFPSADQLYRYFVEQELRPSVPEADWNEWIDPRPPNFRQKVEQVPKFWSSGTHAFSIVIGPVTSSHSVDSVGNRIALKAIPGTCNFALMSFVRGDRYRPVSLSRWSDVYINAVRLTQTCLDLNYQGGAATIDGKPAGTSFPLSSTV